MSFGRGSTPRQTDRLTVSHNVTLTLTIVLEVFQRSNEGLLKMTFHL
jgi:hypothetical protein